MNLYDDDPDELAAHLRDDAGAVATPLSDERLLSIRAHVELAYHVLSAEDVRREMWRVYPDLAHDFTCDGDDLLAEVERRGAALAAAQAREAALVARLEAALAVVRAVEDRGFAQDIDDPEWVVCLACGGGGPTDDAIEHHAACYYIEARALLASAEQEGGGDGQQR